MWRELRGGGCLREDDSDNKEVPEKDHWMCLAHINVDLVDIVKSNM